MDDPKSEALSKALHFLRYRPRTQEEVRRRLKREKFSDETVAEVMKDLSETSWFDDVGFAKKWAEERLRTRGLSLSAIKQELRRKGVSQEDVDHALEDVAFDEWEVVAAFLDKKSRSIRDDQKLVQVLVRRGYSYEKAKHYVAMWRNGGV